MKFVSIALLSVVFIGTTDGSGVVAPSEAPDVISDYPVGSSLYPLSDYPVSLEPSWGDTSRWPGLSCPDTDGFIIDTLFGIFGAENCTRSNPSDDQGYIQTDCEYTNPTWFRGSARYNARRNNNGVVTPLRLQVTDTLKYGVSGADWIDFECADPSGVGRSGNCIDGSDFLSSVQWKIQFPQGGPQCGNADGDIEYVKNKKKKRTITCDQLAAKPWKKRVKLCKISELRESCPGICQVDPDCECIDIPGEFKSGVAKGKNKFFTCDRLRTNKRIGKRCSKPLYQKNCPSVCLGQCRTNF